MELATAGMASFLLAWDTISPIVTRVQNANLCSKFTSTLGVTLGVAGALAATAYVGYELGFWTKAEAINTMLDLAKHLAH
jgi:hypothetical protein